jgi:5-methyltetrahydropteroyltriglutamate--homocysteine methyltransferase
MVDELRADQVGSLLRPAALLRAREAYAAGTLTADMLREAEDQAILDALARQRALGFPILVDGELRRRAWMTDMADAVEGFVPQSRPMHWKGPGGGVFPSHSHVVGGRLRPRRRLTGEQTAFLHEHAGGPFKMTLPAPSNFFVASWHAGVSDQAYASRSEMLADVVTIVRDEVEALIGQGVTYVQLDSPFYSSFFDDDERARLRDSGVDPDVALAEVVAADNACVAGLRRDGLTLGMHICRGNSRSRWMAEGGYDRIAEELFGKLDVDRFLLEYDSPRDGGFEPLRYLPKGKTAVIGLVTTKEPALEPSELLRQRVDEAARFVPLEQLALSPQCGFASVAEGNLLSEDDQWRKLELVLQTAHDIWS